jgi:hypothetical protein
VERQLIEFLRHHTYTRLDGKPWRLIANGDMVDFLGICLLPNGEHEATPDEIIYGLGRRPRVARQKMEAVVERHASVFRALARFIGAGNALDIIAGNHDVEFHWKAVQSAFKEGVRRAWEDLQLSRGRASTDSQRIADGISFHPWFFYEPGVVWVEHGHLYDENCSFQFALAPACQDSKEVDVNVDAAASRYVINRIPEADHGQENWSGMGYLRWAWGLGARGAFQLAKSYYAFSARLLAARRQRANMPGAGEVRRERHRERLRKLCEKWSLEESTLDAIDELRKRPVVNNLWRLLQVLMIDKIVLGAGALLVLMVLFWSMPLSWGMLAAGGVLGTAWAANKYLSRGRNVDPTGPLLIVPDRILRHVDARYVVFGHTHDPLAIQLDNGGTYFNTGTWFPDELPGLLRSFTHVVIRHGKDGPHAELCQWRDGASRVFTPGYTVRFPMPAIVDAVADDVAAPKAEAAA